LLVVLHELEAQDLHFDESWVPGEARGSVHHFLPGGEGSGRPLGDILFVDELAVMVAASKSIAGIGSADAVVGAKRGGGHELLVPSVDEGPRFIDGLFRSGLLGVGKTVISAWGALGSYQVGLGGMFPGAVGLPGGGDGCDRDQFNVLNDLAVTRDSIVKNAKGFKVARHGQLVVTTLPKEENILGVLGKTSAEPGVLIQDRGPPAENVAGLALVELEPGARFIGRQLKCDLTCKAEHEGVRGAFQVQNGALVQGPQMPAMLARRVTKDS